MGADGRCGKIQIHGNALHRRAAGEPDEDFEFSFGQPFHRRLRTAVEFRQRQLLGKRAGEISPRGKLMTVI